MILVTGASGFIGRALCGELARKGFLVRGAARTADASRFETVQNVETAVMGPLTARTDWTRALEGVDTVVHLAARTHVLREKPGDSLAEYRETNVEATRQLARMAVASRVNRFLFMSSVKVNGEQTHDRPFCESDRPHPEDAYGITKWEAEQVLARIAADSDMKLIVLRAPLVYGPSVKANFLRLMRWIARGTPLPLATVRNRRSLIYVGNLVDAIASCIEADIGPSKTYLLSDGEDLSTPELIRALAAALGVPARLFSFPMPALKLAAALLGKRAEIARLTESLQVDSTRIRTELKWRPPFRLAEGLEQTARWYKESTETRS